MLCLVGWFPPPQKKKRHTHTHTEMGLSVRSGTRLLVGFKDKPKNNMYSCFPLCRGVPQPQKNQPRLRGSSWPPRELESSGPPLSVSHPRRSPHLPWSPARVSSSAPAKLPQRLFFLSSRRQSEPPKTRYPPSEHVGFCLFKAVPSESSNPVPSDPPEDGA